MNVGKYILHLKKGKRVIKQAKKEDKLKKD